MLTMGSLVSASGNEVLLYLNYSPRLHFFLHSAFLLWLLAFWTSGCARFPFSRTSYYLLLCDHGKERDRPLQNFTVPFLVTVEVDAILCSSGRKKM